MQRFRPFRPETVTWPTTFVWLSTPEHESMKFIKWIFAIVPR
jgi:hypothetical protein